MTDLGTRRLCFPHLPGDGRTGSRAPSNKVPLASLVSATGWSSLLGANGWISIFTVLFNMVDSTVGVLPITRVDSKTDSIPPDFLDGSQGSKILEGRTYGGNDPAYDADKMHGLPVGVQLVAKPWEEEKVLAMMAQLEELIGYKYD